jgi:hypothetical protein
MNFYQEHKKIIWIGIVLILFYFINSPSSVSNQYLHDDSFMAKGMVAESGFMGDYVRESSYATLETDDYESDKGTLLALPEKFGGYITNQNENKYDIEEKEYRTYRVSFKVPKEKFDVAIEEVKGLAEVQSISFGADDISDNYEDLETYLASYKKEKEKLDSLLEQATDVEDMIIIQSRLSEVQRQIDYYQGRIDDLTEQTTFGTMSVTLNEERPAISTIWTPFKAHWRNLLQSIDDIFVFVSSYLLYVLIGLVAWYIWKD